MLMDWDWSVSLGEGLVISGLVTRCLETGVDTGHKNL